MILIINLYNYFSFYYLIFHFSMLLNMPVMLLPICDFAFFLCILKSTCMLFREISFLLVFNDILLLLLCKDILFRSSFLLANPNPDAPLTVMFIASDKVCSFLCIFVDVFDSKLEPSSFDVFALYPIYFILFSMSLANSSLSTLLV